MNDQVSSLYELLDICSSLDSSSSNYEASRVELTNLMLNIIKEMKEEEAQEKEEDKVANVYNDSLLEDTKEIEKGDNSYD